MTDLPVFAFGLTDVGGRKTNEDAFHMAEQHEAAKIAARGRLYVVADGTGGQEGGGTASVTAAGVVGENYYDNTSDDLGESLRTAIQTAHQTLFHLAEGVASWRNMSTTLVAVAIKGNEYWAAHVGDSRLYLVRGDKVQQLTQDHSWQEDDDNFGSLTRWLGGGDQPAVEVDLQHGTLKEGDVLLLCTDGFYSQVSKDDMRDLTRRMGVKPAVQQMIAMSKARGTSDNTTAIAIRLGGGAIEAAQKRRQMIFVGGGVAAALALIVLIIALGSNSGSGSGPVKPGDKPTLPPTAVKFSATDTGLEASATPILEVTAKPGEATSTLRPTSAATATSTPRPTLPPGAKPLPTQPAVAGGEPTATSAPACPAGQSWDPVMSKCRGSGGGDGGGGSDPGRN